MGENRSVYYPRTTELPISISYFCADGITRTPLYIHTSESLEFTFIQSGLVEIEVNGKLFVLRKGQIHMIIPGDTYIFRSLTPDSQYIHIAFDPASIQPVTNSFLQTRFFQPLAEGRLTVPRILSPEDDAYDAIRKEFDRPDLNIVGTDIFKCQLHAAAVSLCAGITPYCTILDCAKTPQKNTADVVWICLNHIQMHYKEKISLSELAELVHLHPNYLCALFKEITGISLFEHLTRYRINRAARILRSNRTPINQVAELCGFQSASFFCRKFTEFYGMTPSAYRKNFTHKIIDKAQ